IQLLIRPPSHERGVGCGSFLGPIGLVNRKTDVATGSGCTDYLVFAAIPAAKRNGKTTRGSARSARTIKMSRSTSHAYNSLKEDARTLTSTAISLPSNGIDMSGPARYMPDTFSAAKPRSCRNLTSALSFRAPLSRDLRPPIRRHLRACLRGADG